MLTDLNDLSSCAAIGEHLLKLWFEELDSLDQCPDVCTLNYMIDDLARMTAIHKSLLHMSALAQRLANQPSTDQPSPTTPKAPTTPTTPIGPMSPIGPIGPIGPMPPLSPISPIGPISPISPSDSLLTNPSATRSTIHDSRSTTLLSPSLRETPLLREIPMLRDLTPDQIRTELDRMIPYLEERLVEFHVVETEEPLSEDDISEEFSEESVDSIDSFSTEDDSPTTPSVLPESSVLPRNRSR